MWHDWKKARKWWMLAGILLVGIVIYIAIDARKTDVSGKVVVCIPVYGQSLALGFICLNGSHRHEAANFDSGHVHYVIQSRL